MHKDNPPRCVTIGGSQELTTQFYDHENLLEFMRSSSRCHFDDAFSFWMYGAGTFPRGSNWTATGRYGALL
ncbi:hypothetical protein H6P81_000668 [Aristolochia fimbriata]|uniref:Uncharacterized protein n=1 Tax=Aristolochia fimbriata TaxID=158543 RepID=A0AAV7F7D4_ARIFI|nr:hypothetical protein H6P81_000668 [Aristolochia fimbriata]